MNSLGAPSRQTWFSCAVPSVDIANHLFEKLQVTEEDKRRLTKRLAALLAHRMLSDIHRLNEMKLQFGIQLSIAAIVFSWPFALLGETLLRAFRVT